jgi:glyoxylase-like metal-dependent hydrolase (beta-lactamase superfamily II)
MKILTIRYKSTNYYLIDTGKGLLAFDAGWPDTYIEYKDLLKSHKYKISDIKWLIVSHFHIDHAGLAGLMVDKEVRFFVFKNQLYAIEEMESLMARKGMQYHKLNLSKISIIDISESRSILMSIGISGEVVQTDGHGEQSITLLLDSGEAFIGDLPPENMIGTDDNASMINWQILKSKGARIIKPAHADEYIIK